jgi:hypothetical protein
MEPLLKRNAQVAIRCGITPSEMLAPPSLAFTSVSRHMRDRTMNYRDIPTFNEAAHIAKELARNSGIPAKLIRAGRNWHVDHPDLLTDTKRENTKRHSIEPIKRPSGRESGRMFHRNLKSKNSSFKFAIRKISSTEPIFADNPEVEKDKIVRLVKEYFPNAFINSSIKVTDAAGIRICEWRREYLILLTITDQTNSQDAFNETLNDLASEFEYMHLHY